MILAAPLVIPFAEAVGISIATLGMAKAADMVNDYIQENPEQSAMILKTLVPNLGIGEIFMKKDSGDDEEVSEEEVTESGSTKDMVLEELNKEKGNYSDPEAKGNYASPRGRIIGRLRREGKIRQGNDPNYDPSKKYQGYKRFLKKADGGAIGIEVLFEEKKPRQGLFMGGPALEGQALNIYNSMNAYGFQDQEIADALSAQGLYTAPGSTPDTPDTTPGQTIGFQGGDNSPVSLFGENLNKTYSTENVSPIGGTMTQQLLTLDEKKGNPAFMGTVPNPEDYPYSGPVQQFSQIGENLYDVNPKGKIKGQRTYKTPRTIGDQVYAASQSDGLGSISKKDLYNPSLMSKGITAVQDFFGKFSQPKIKGTLGDRLLKQSQGMTIPTLTGAFAKLRSPFNPQSATYNAALPMQLNFLEMGQVGDKSGLNLIGRNEGSGLLQYGEDSVLSGKNVISGFGTNDYETALRNFISRMNANTRISDTRKIARLAAAQAELDALMAKQAQEYKDSGTQAEVAALQKEIDSGKYSGGSDFAQSNQAAVGGGAKGKAANTDNSKSTGTSQGYSQHYARGGLVTMFKEKR